MWKEWLHTVVSIEDDASTDDAAERDDCDGVYNISKQTGHWQCSVSFGDDVDDAKKGPSKLTPSSPLTRKAWYTEHVSDSSRDVYARR